MGEHTGTHVDALSHMDPEYAAQTINTMPLSQFYTEGFCLDFSNKKPKELIEAAEIDQACSIIGLPIKKGDTLLIYTDHFRKTYGTREWTNGPGLSAEAAVYLGEKGISAFGVETMAPGVSGISNREVHQICGKYGFTHYENLVNLHLLIGRGRFRFIGFPLKIRGGTGSPVRAVAIFE
jgi:kynurenine formamidase